MSGNWRSLGGAVSCSFSRLMSIFCHPETNMARKMNIDSGKFATLVRETVDYWEGE